MNLNSNTANLGVFFPGGGGVGEITRNYSNVSSTHFVWSVAESTEDCRVGRKSLKVFKGENNMGWKLPCTCKQCMIVLFQQTAYLDRRCVESWGSIPPDSDTGILPSNSHRRHYCTDCLCPHTHQYLQHRKTKYKLQLGVDFYIRITW